jgi:hypothetical protein
MTEPGPGTGQEVDPDMKRRIYNLFTRVNAQSKQREDDRRSLMPVEVERSRIRKMIRDWPSYVKLHLELTENPIYFELYEFPGLTIENITDNETAIRKYYSTLVNQSVTDTNFDMRKMNEISRINDVFTDYIKYNKIYRDNPVCPELTRSAINMSCYRKFAMNEWITFIENQNFFSPETIINMLRKRPSSMDRPSDREPIRPLEQMLNEIDEYVSENLAVLRKGGQSISSRKIAKRHPRRKSSTIKRRLRRRRTSRK